MLFMFKVIFILIVLLFSELSHAAKCVKYIDSQYIAYYETNALRYLDYETPASGCNETVTLTPSEYARFELLEEQNSETIEITALDIGESFTWGFGTYIFFWFLSYVIKNARNTIKQI